MLDKYKHSLDFSRLDFHFRFVFVVMISNYKTLAHPNKN
jgi:hypothetical protein